MKAHTLLSKLADLFSVSAHTESPAASLAQSEDNDYSNVDLDSDTLIAAKYDQRTN